MLLVTVHLQARSVNHITSSSSVDWALVSCKRNWSVGIMWASSRLLTLGIVARLYNPKSNQSPFTHRILSFQEYHTFLLFYVLFTDQFSLDITSDCQLIFIYSVTVVLRWHLEQNITECQVYAGHGRFLQFICFTSTRQCFCHLPTLWIIIR